MKKAKRRTTDAFELWCWRRLFLKIYIYLFIWLFLALAAACGIKFPDQGLNPGTLHWEHRVLAAGPPGKSLEKTLESPLGCKIQPVHPKGNQSWVFIGRTDAEAETPVLWPPHGKS